MAVEQGLLRLVPSERRDELREHAVRVELADANDRYRVKVSKDGVTVSKTYLDTARDCASRENIAAVFAVLTVMPPEIGVAPEPATEPAPVPPVTARAAPPAPRQRPRLPPFVRVELSGMGVAAPAILDAPAIAGLGGELRTAFGRRAYALTLSLGYLPPAHFELSGVEGEVTRLPASAGLRLRHELDAWTVQLDFGVLVASDRVRTTSLLRSASRRTFDAGFRAGLSVSPFGNARLRPFAGVFVWTSLLSRELAAAPQGALGNLPQVWLGGAVGVAVGL